MRENLVSFETAKIANRVGFHLVDSCITYYSKEGTTHTIRLNLSLENRIRLNDKILLAPRQGLLQKWLREKHNIDVTVITNFFFKRERLGYLYEIARFVDNVQDGKDYNSEQLKKVGKEQGFQTYEEALETGLQEALKLI